jgi:hypothetical protein
LVTVLAVETNQCEKRHTDRQHADGDDGICANDEVLFRLLDTSSESEYFQNENMFTRIITLQFTLKSARRYFS